MPNQVTAFLLHTMSGIEMSTYEPNSTTVNTHNIPPHPVQANSQLPPHRFLAMLLCGRIRQVQVPTSPVRLDTRCCLGGLHQQEAQQGTALLADGANRCFPALESSHGILPRTCRSLAALKPLGVR